PDDIVQSEQSITGRYLSGKESIPIPKKRLKQNLEKVLQLEGATGNNLKNSTVEMPLGLMTCVTGVSGSGKSTLIDDTLYPVADTMLNRATILRASPHKKVHGLEYLDKVIDIDQSPIGRTPRSNAATYTGIFTPVRELFAQMPEARARGY